MYFTDKFCMQCVHCDPDPQGEKQCDILLASLCYSVSDKEYPKEWIYDKDNKPTCTKFQYWDWGNDDDGKTPPEEPEPEDPNQLMLFTPVDDILTESYKKVTKELEACSG